ncbi:hypothetical protein WP12_10600 [Sphingomonas sp. SRS2]|nr:hypothetical protein WP12_10600 [Sphingomonas sp. SRS2]
MEWTPRQAAVRLILLYLAAKIVMLLAGSRFDADNLTSWMQIIDLELLRHDLWRSLYYLHTQPPLFNLLIGLTLKLGLAAFPWVMLLIYGVVTLGGILAFHAVAADISGRPRLSFIVAAWLCVAPSVLLFSQKLYYDGLVPWMLMMALWGLHSGAVRRSGPRLLFGFSMLAATILLRAMIHPLLLFLAAGIMVALFPGQRRRLIVTAIGPAAAILLVLAKNFMVFGIVQLSSWAPLSLGHTTVERLPVATRIELMHQGKLSRFAPVSVFAPPGDYLKVMPAPAKTGVPLLDNMEKSSGEANWNHVLYTKIGPERVHDALFAMRYAPASFAKVLVTSLYHFHRPASEFKGLERNLAHIRGWDRFSNAVIGLQPTAWFGSSLDKQRPQSIWLQPSYSALLLTLAFLGAGFACLAALLRAVRLRQRPDESLAIPIIIAGFGLFVIMVSSSFDVWENNRAHYDIAPVLLLGALWFVGRRPRSAEAPAA